MGIRVLGIRGGRGLFIRISSWKVMFGYLFKFSVRFSCRAGRFVFIKEKKVLVFWVDGEVLV